MRTNNPMLREDTLRNASASSEAMTINGAVGKTLIMLLLLVATSMYSYVQVMNHKMNISVMMGAMIIAAIVAIATTFVPRISPITAPIYAAVEGIVLGSVSAMFTLQAGDSIVLQAVLLTFAILFAMLILYATRIIRVTDKFRMAVFSATLGVVILYVGTAVLHLFGVQVPYLHDGGTVSIIVSAIIIVIASLNLVLDFDFIETGASQRAPKYMEWYGALGLMLTLVWLYFEILRFISYFTRND